MKKSIAILLAPLTIISAHTALGAIHEINVGDSFSPQATTVMPGDTVRWVLASGTHSIVSDPSSPKTFASGELTSVGQSFDVAFHLADGPGPFPYHCGDHPEVVDTIYTTDICLASFDINGDGFPLSVSDLVALIREIKDIEAGTVPIPDNLYQADLTADCVVDSNDVNLLISLFQNGFSIVPHWPVPTCCYPTLGAFNCCQLRGDIDHSGGIDISDVIVYAEYMFLGSGFGLETCSDEVDVNGDGAFDVSDLIYLIDYSFTPGSPAPPPCYSVH